MNIKHHTHPDQLTTYSFLWSELRLMIAAVALFIGGQPPLRWLFPALFVPINFLLTLAWVISGVASLYLLYRWKQNNQHLFGAKKPYDMYAFLVSVVSGVNLGFTGLFGVNPGMSLSSNYAIYIIVGVLYLLSASYLWNRWNESRQKLF